MLKEESMKNIEKIFVLSLFVLLFSGCYDREIVDRKDFNHTLPKVENLSYTKQENTVTLNWQIPADISDNFRRPLETSIQVVENNIYRQKFSIFDENKTANFQIDPTKEYRVIVRLLGFLNTDVIQEGFTDRVFSDGVILEIN